jgi:hypothetical protein
VYINDGKARRAVVSEHYALWSREVSQDRRLHIRKHGRYTLSCLANSVISDHPRFNFGVNPVKVQCQWFICPGAYSEATDSDVINLNDADEALAFLENHPRREEIIAEGTATLEDPVRLKKLVRNIDYTIVPVLAAVYFFTVS